MPPADGSGMLPRVGEPESAMLPGMGAPAPHGGPGPLAPTLLLDTPGPGPYALQEPPGWLVDFNPATGSARATFNGEVAFVSGGAATAGVTSWNTRTGAVTFTLGDLTGIGGAPLASPIFTGVPAAPTAAPGVSTTQLATTAFVGAAIAAAPVVSSWNGRVGAVTLTTADITSAGGAPLASPALTGTPTAPTASLADQSGQIATTQFVANKIAGGAVASWNGRQGVVTLSLSDLLSVGGAPIASPNFTGNPTAPTPAPGNASTLLATTAFVTNAVTAAASGVASFNTRTGAVTLLLADVVAAGGAPINSPTLTGVPLAPTPTGGDSSTKIATTAFVGAAIAGASNVSSWNGRTGAVTFTLADGTGVGLAPIASPTFTGTPAAPTAAPGTNTTQLATTGFVAAAVAPLASSASVTASLALKADLASPTLTGDPKAPTPAPGDNDTSIATTAFVGAAIAAAPSPAGTITKILPRIFTTSGTYVPTAGLLYATIEAVGGGGGGGGSAGTGSPNQSQGGGGGGGSYSKLTAPAATIGASINVIIGAGGPGGAAGANDGIPGNDTFVGASLGTAICSGRGGSPGTGAASAGSGVGGIGGVPGIGDFTLTGQSGEVGYQQTSLQRGPGGNGGAAGFGMGAGGVKSNTAVDGSPGQLYGGGGAGGGSANGLGAHAGGAGANGVVIITEYVH